MSSAQNYVERQRIINLAEAKGDFGRLEDGYWYYFSGRSGAISARQLRVIADELDSRNWVWDEKVKQELSSARGIDGNHPNC